MYDEKMNQEPTHSDPPEDQERPNIYAELGGGTDKGEAARAKIHRDIAERAARKLEAQDNSAQAQAARQRAEIARRIAKSEFPTGQ